MVSVLNATEPFISVVSFTPCEFHLDTSFSIKVKDDPTESEDHQANKQDKGGGARCHAG